MSICNSGSAVQETSSRQTVETCVFLFFSLCADQASFSRRSNHKSSTQRLPNDGEDAQADVGAARVHPRRAAPQQKPHRRSALPKEETRLHPKPGV